MEIRYGQQVGRGTRWGVGAVRGFCIIGTGGAGQGGGGSGVGEQGACDAIARGRQIGKAMAAVQPAGTAGADGVGCVGAGVDCERAAEGVVGSTLRRWAGGVPGFSCQFRRRPRSLVAEARGFVGRVIGRGLHTSGCQGNTDDFPNEFCGVGGRCAEKSAVPPTRLGQTATHARRLPPRQTKKCGLT